jgi:hypothetical protein
MWKFDEGSENKAEGRERKYDFEVDPGLSDVELLEPEALSPTAD